MRQVPKQAATSGATRETEAGNDGEQAVKRRRLAPAKTPGKAARFRSPMPNTVGLQQLKININSGGLVSLDDATHARPLRGGGLSWDGGVSAPRVRTLGATHSRSPMPRSTSRRLAVSPVDAAWLRMDSPTNPMVITSVYRFDAPLEDAALEDNFTRLIENGRFRMRAVRDRRSWTGASWEDDPAFDLSRHWERHRLPGGADGEALDAFIGARMSEPLDRGRPLWRAIAIDGLKGGGSALLFRIHHAVGDGVTLVRQLLRVAGAGADRAPVDVGISRPERPRTLRDAVVRGRDDTATLIRLLTIPPDHRTRLRGPLGTRKVVATSGPISLPAIQSLARATGAHVNDLLSAAVAGAVRAYLGDPPPLRALVPVFLRDDIGGGGNHFGLVYLPLPVHVPSREGRTRAVKAAMDAIKAAPDTTVAFAVLGAMGLVSPTLERLGIDLFTCKASMLITNVPGPAGVVRVAGQEVRSIVVWAPTSGSLGLGFSLLTYAGELRLGVAADAGLVSDPQALVVAFEREIEAMRAQAA